MELSTFAIFCAILLSLWIGFCLGLNHAKKPDNREQKAPPEVVVQTVPERKIIAVSVAGAVQCAQILAGELLRHHEYVTGFYEFTRTGHLKERLEDAERGWTMIQSGEHPWIMVQWIREAFMKAIAKEGFESRWSYNDDLGPSKIFISVVGREDSAVHRHTAFG
jgi:hypothetical protein